MRAGSEKALLSIADGLDAGTVRLGSSPVGFAGLARVDGDLAATVFKSFQAIGDDLDETAVAAALRVAAEIRREEHLGRPTVEICWTGPDADGPLVTPSAAAIQRLVHDCRDTGEILLVGYSLTVGHDTQMSDFVDLLVAAAKRRARITVVLHEDGDGRNRRQLLNAWDPTARKPDIYTWDPPPNHPYTKLHAKCLVVDRLQMLVTSANFTFHGLESNIELGLLVANQPLATAVHEQFDHLISSKGLHKWDATK